MLQVHGGTTGCSQGRDANSYNLFANAIQTAVWAEESTDRGNERYLLVIPYFHIYGQTVGMLLGRERCASNHDPEFDVDMLLKAINNINRPSSRRADIYTSDAESSRRKGEWSRSHPAL